jgi:hypothetical protein
LFDGGNPSGLTISFNQPVLGGGLFIIDYFDPQASNPLTIEAFTGVNGTGTSLGLFSSVAFNFQPNNLYFMGIVSTDNNIRSIIFRDVNSSTGDTTGIDDIRFAVQANQPIPEPSTMTIWTLVVLGGAACTYRRRRQIV